MCFFECSPGMQHNENKTKGVRFVSQVIFSWIASPVTNDEL